MAAGSPPDRSRPGTPARVDAVTRDIYDAVGLAEQRFPQQALVRPAAVTVRGVSGQYPAEMLFAEDQHMVQALAAKRSRVPLRERVRRGRWTGVLITCMS